ncbi:copper resistance CopC family protein [Kineococcus esterisolvens]|uniref:copper resistance CopC family protein n=1 Tax=unclassified Kineococcus TaxID=2621656 RepID=UPI003D7CCF28
MLATRRRSSPAPTAHRTARSAAAVALGLSTAAGGVLATAPAASAHDRLVSTDPAADAVLAQAPEQVVLTMSAAPVGLGTQVQVTGPTGVVSTGEARVVDETVTQALAAERPAGTYEVQWRVTSSDGHPISGTFSFTAEAAVAAPAATTAPTADVVTSSPASDPATAETSPTPDGDADPIAGAAGDDAGQDGGVGTGVVAAVVAAVVAVLAGVGVIAARRRRRG